MSSPSPFTILNKVKVADGDLWHISFLSSKLGGTEAKLQIFIPSCATKEHPVPHIYYLPGMTQNETICQRIGPFKKAEELGIALVFTDTAPRNTGIAGEDGSSFYVNAKADPWARFSQMRDYIVDEVVSLIENNFPVTKSKSIMGHSMGGHGALAIAMKTSGMFSSVSAFAPICNPSKTEKGKEIFTAYLGDDTELWKTEDITELMRNYCGSNLHILIDQGLEDGFLHRQELMPEHFQAACEASGHPVIYLTHPGYDHSPQFFVSSFIDEHLIHHAKYLIKNHPECGARNPGADSN